MHGRRFDFGARQNPSFGSSEHRSLGDFVHLNLPQSLLDVAPDAWKNKKLRVGRSELSYGEIVALAGDLYGIPSQPISDGTTDADRQTRFLAAFATLESADPDEVSKLVALISEEADAIKRNIINDGVPANVAAKANDYDDEYTMATGGWVPYDGVHSRYLQLAETNYDHFGFDAVTAYIAGHTVAINLALEAARDSKDSVARTQVFAKYERALSLNAFADHFLTDLFSAGHLRVPRRKAVEQEGEVVGGVASKAQHDEDSHWGLFVKSRRGHCWKCYGDNHLNTQQGVDNREHVREAIVSSVREIYNTFTSGPPVAYEPLELIPDLDYARHAAKPNETDIHLNFAALFLPVKDSPAIAVREPMDDTNSYHWALSGFTADLLSHFEVSKPPHDYLPAPADKPIFSHWGKLSNPARAVSPVGLKRVRYALANVGYKQYPHGGLGTYYSSEQGSWGDWIDTRVGECPHLAVQKDPDSRTVRRILLRQVEGELPVLNFRVLNENKEQEVIDADA